MKDFATDRKGSELRGPTASHRHPLNRACGPALIVSLDFEMLWGLAGEDSPEKYQANVRGEWSAVPALLRLFREFSIGATWATVGMLVCKNHDQWRDMRPSLTPRYHNPMLSAYNLEPLARELPDLFFARPLVEQVLQVDRQEVASHTYSHFYCCEEGVTPEQFNADMECASQIFSEIKVKPTSIVFPRNQICEICVNALPALGINAYRGTLDHWLHRDGHAVSWGKFGRMLRLADSYFPIARYRPDESTHLSADGEIVDLPASMFLRPASRSAIVNRLHLLRAKSSMLKAARSGGIFHLWWHPHNFGVHIEDNLIVLRSLLEYFALLRGEYGMKSLTMAEATTLIRSEA